MTPLILAVLAIVGVGALGFAFVPQLMGSSRADKRIKALQGDIQANRRTADAERTRDNRRKQIQATLRQQNEALGKKKRVSLQDQIYQAGMKIKARDYIRNEVILGVVIAAVAFFLHRPIGHAWLANIRHPSLWSARRLIRSGGSSSRDGYE